MNYVGIYEAKTYLPKLIQRVLQGEAIIITKHGDPVVELKPVAKHIPKQEMTRKQAIERILSIRESNGTINMTARELIDEGRKR